MGLEAKLVSDAMPSIAHDLHLHEVPGDELEAIIGSLLSHGRLDLGSSEVIYSTHQSGDCALSLHYDDGVLIDIQTGPACAEEMLDQLTAQVEHVLLVDEGTVVRRDIWFSIPKIEGYWRHGDTLQLLPAPPDAPGVPYEIGEHPFVLETRVRRSSNGSIAIARAVERRRELQLVLSLACMGRVTRTSPTVQKHWAIVWEPDEDAAQAETRYVQEGYSLSGFVVVQDEFSAPRDIEPLKVVPSGDYFLDSSGSAPTQSSMCRTACPSYSTSWKWSERPLESASYAPATGSTNRPGSGQLLVRSATCRVSAR